MPATIDDYQMSIINENGVFKAKLVGMLLSATGNSEEEAIANLKKAFKEEFN